MEKSGAYLTGAIRYLALGAALIVLAALVESVFTPLIVRATY
jgi:uncharacterized membrane protein SpoIIM required for sporulation